jgi:hypothetical protein
MAGYHQFHAVKVAVEETLRAATARKADLGRHGGDPGVSPHRSCLAHAWNRARVSPWPSTPDA